MAISEPIPKHKMSKPSVDSPIFNLDFTKGISGAQADMPSPVMRNAKRVDICCAKAEEGVADIKRVSNRKLNGNGSAGATYQAVKHYTECRQVGVSDEL